MSYGKLNKYVFHDLLPWSDCIGQSCGPILDRLARGQTKSAPKHYRTVKLSPHNLGVTSEPTAAYCAPAIGLCDHLIGRVRRAAADQWVVELPVRDEITERRLGRVELA